MIGEPVRWGNRVGTVTKTEGGYAFIQTASGERYRVREETLRAAMGWTRQEFDEQSGEPLGAAFTDHLTVAKSEPVERPTPEPPKTTAPQHGASWLGDDGRRREISKSRGRLFADLVLSDDMIVDAEMRRGE